MSDINVTNCLSSFDIHGIKFCVETNSQTDANWIRFILRNYIQEQCCENQVHIEVPEEVNGSYMHTYLNNQTVENFIITKDNNRLIWQSKSTPIPPFLFAPYRGNYVLLHGCAVLSPNNKVSIFLGDSMMGKTYLSISLLRNGYRLIADDLIIFRIADQNILPYHKPIGLRETTVEHDPHLRLVVNNKSVERLEFRADSGKKTWLIHVEDIFGDNTKAILPLSEIDRVVCLHKDCTKMIPVSVSRTIVHICSGIINSGLSQKSTLSFLLNKFSSIREMYFAPAHAGTLVADFINEKDRYV